VQENGRERLNQHVTNQNTTVNQGTRFTFVTDSPLTSVKPQIVVELRCPSTAVYLTIVNHNLSVLVALGDQNGVVDGDECAFQRFAVLVHGHAINASTLAFSSSPKWQNDKSFIVTPSVMF
jgi:hypothetical protein